MDCPPSKGWYGSNPVWIRLILSLLLVGTEVGCSRRPAAPVLDNDPVFVNRGEGFRLLIPEGWSQAIKTNLPPGVLEKERTLVLYRAFDKNPASFEVTCIDLGEDADIDVYVTSRKRSGAGWTRSAEKEKVTVDGREGNRYYFQATVRGQPTSAEVVVFQKAKRFYFFSGYFPKGDLIRQKQIRQFLADLSWLS